MLAKYNSLHTRDFVSLYLVISFPIYLFIFKKTRNLLTLSGKSN